MLPPRTNPLRRRSLLRKPLLPMLEILVADEWYLNQTKIMV
jgi:hypothetical protein